MAKKGDEWTGTYIEEGIWKCPKGWRVRAEKENPMRPGKPLDRSWRVRDPEHRITHARARLAELRAQLTRIVSGEWDNGTGLIFRDFWPVRIAAAKAKNEITSPKTEDKLETIRPIVFDKWGDNLMDRVTHADVEAWYLELCEIAKGRVYKGRTYAASYVRQWWAAFAATMKAWANRYRKTDPCDGIGKIPDAATGPYTAVETNSFDWRTGGVRKFFEAADRICPEIVAECALGILTSRRPSELRPIRKSGPDADINLETGIVLIRRSQVGKHEAIKGTKAKAGGVAGIREEYTIALPPALIAIIRRHIDRQTGLAAASELLFPGADGEYRCEKTLANQMARVAKEAGIPIKITPKSLRRTFHDLARAVPGLRDLTIKSMGGHPLAPIPGASGKTLAYLYSTVPAAEQREAIEAMARVGGVFEAVGLAARGIVAAEVQAVAA